MKRVLVLLSLLILLSIFASSPISALVFNAPLQSGTVDDLYTINATPEGDSALNGIPVNVSYLIKSSSSTANTTFNEFGVNNSINLSGETIFFAFNFSTVFEDGADYILGINITNASGGALVENGQVTSVVIDHTIPTAPTSLSPTSSTSDDVTFSATVGGTLTTSCTLIFDGKSPGSSTYSATNTGNTCSVTVNDVPEETYNYYFRASDGTNTTDSSITSFSQSTGSGISGPINPKNVPRTGSSGGGLIVFLILVVVLVGWLMTKR